MMGNKPNYGRTVSCDGLNSSPEMRPLAPHLYNTGEKNVFTFSLEQVQILMNSLYSENGDLD